MLAGKPFDEGAVRRAFDEMIMPFVTVYERPLLARADLVLKKSATHAIQRFDRSLVQKLEAIAERHLAQAADGSSKLPLSLVEQALSTLQLRSASRWVWELLARRGVATTLTKEQFVSVLSAAIDSSTASGTSSFYFRQPRIHSADRPAAAPCRFRCASAASRLKFTPDAATEEPPRKRVKEER